MPRINLLARDFDSIKQELINITGNTIPSLAAGLKQDDVLQLFLNWFAMIGDILSFQIDMAINEAFVDTAVQFESLSRMTKLAGITVKLPTPTIVVCSTALAVPVASDVTIPAGVSVKILGEEFQSLENFVIPAGLTVANGLTLVQGRTVKETFTAQGIPNETFVLTNSPVLEGTIQVSTAFGEAIFVDSLVKVDGPVNAFEIDVDEGYAVTIRFGDNVNGAVLPPNSVVNVTYRVMNRNPVNILPNVINTTVTGFSGEGTPVTVTVFNPGAGITGVFGDNIETLRRRIKSAMQRTVTHITQNDLVSTINKFAIMSAVNVVRDTTIIDQINIFVWKRDNITGRLGVVPQTSIDILDELLEKIRPLNVRFNIVPGRIKPIVLKAKVVTTSFDVNDVTQRVKTSLIQFFLALVPGSMVNVADIISFVLNANPDVTSIQLFDSTNNVFMSYQQADNELSDLVAVSVEVTTVS